MTKLSKFLNSEAGKAKSRREWANAMRISASYLSEVESGKCTPSLKTALRITTATGVPIESLVALPVAAPTPEGATA